MYTKILLLLLFVSRLLLLLDFGPSSSSSIDRTKDILLLTFFAKPLFLWVVFSK